MQEETPGAPQNYGYGYGPPRYQQQYQPPPAPQYQPPGNSFKQKKHSGDGWRNALSTIAILILAPLVAILLTSFVFQSYEVDGPSMEHALEDQDRLIVWKVPRTMGRLTGNDYVPSRGEIIVFNQSNGSDPAPSGGNRQLIKRVIALPGERVTVKNEVITVFNKNYPQGFMPDETTGYNDGPIPTSGNIDLVVPEGHIFVAGDNRQNSLDSRVFGPIPLDTVVGELAFRIFPFNQVRAF